MEGVGSLLAGILGTGTGTTSYSGNVAAIGVTKVTGDLMILSQIHTDLNFSWSFYCKICKI